MFRSIVVPLDLEPTGDRALPVAGALAAEARIPVELVTVSSPSMTEELDIYELQHRARLLHAACRTTVLHDNDVAGALVSFIAERPDPLVVMATRARGVIAEHVLGSVSETVLAGSARPVLMVGPHVADEDLPAGLTLVAGVDGTSTSEAVLSAVAAWIDTFGGPPPWLVQVLTSAVAAGDHAGMAESADVRRLVARLKEGGIDAEWDVAHAKNPADALIDFADRVADAVLVVGSMRWADPQHSHLTSVARTLTRYAHHPVLVVPATPVPAPRPPSPPHGAMIPE
jgi:nucleotide-binding universal stress UspA family protein